MSQVNEIYMHWWQCVYLIKAVCNKIYTTLAWAFKGATQCLTRILPWQYRKRFANDFDTQPVQRIDAL